MFIHDSTEKVVPLNTLKVGEVAEVEYLDCGDYTKKRIFGYGILPGTTIRVTRKWDNSGAITVQNGNLVIVFSGLVSEQVLVRVKEIIDEREARKLDPDYDLWWPDAVGG